MSVKETECPECHYSTYKYYTKIDPLETAIEVETGKELPIYAYDEVPVVIKSAFGWLCRLCRYEWNDKGVPIDPERSRKHALKIRQGGQEHYEKIHGLKESKQDKPPKLRDRNEGFIPR